jgi:hypothetical protein
MLLYRNYVGIQKLCWYTTTHRGKQVEYDNCSCLIKGRTKLYFKKHSKKCLGKLKIKQSLYRPGEALRVQEGSGS